LKHTGSDVPLTLAFIKEMCSPASRKSKPIHFEISDCCQCVYTSSDSGSRRIIYHTRVQATARVRYKSEGLWSK